MLRKTFLPAVELAALACLVVGAALIYPALGWLTAGAALLAVTRQASA